jgi:hypothetical protein
MEEYIFQLLISLTAGLILAQTIYSPSHYPPIPLRDGKTPPLLMLGAAYDKAVLKLGAETNQFHCISATCLRWLTHMAVLTVHLHPAPVGLSYFWTPMESKEY